MRKVNPTAKKAFDIMHKDKITLKAAWAKAKGGPEKLCVAAPAKASKPKASKPKKCKC